MDKEPKKHPENLGKLHITQDSFILEFNGKNKQKIKSMSKENKIINLLILLAISDNELHKKERDFIEKLIEENNFTVDIDKELEQMSSKFRDDFDTSCLYYLELINEEYLRKITMDLMRKLAAADLIVRDREIKFLDLVKNNWAI